MPVPTNEVTIGQQFVRVETGPLTLNAAGGDQDLLVITGGPIFLERLFGRVITLCRGVAGVAGTTVLSELETHPDETGTEVVMSSAGGLDLDDLNPDCLITLTGGVAAGLIANEIGVDVTPSFQTNHTILAPGHITLVTVDGGAGTIVGSINWTIVYRPLGIGISVVTA